MGLTPDITLSNAAFRHLRPIAAPQTPGGFGVFRVVRFCILQLRTNLDAQHCQQRGTPDNSVPFPPLAVPPTAQDVAHQHVARDLSGSLGTFHVFSVVCTFV